MCGRFVQLSPYNIIKEAFDIGAAPVAIDPNYNVAPTQQILAVVRRDNLNRLERLRWGLVPFWATDIAMGARMINARSETVSDKPSFRHAFGRRRCLIPADGYYEWEGEPGHKQPYFITTNTEGPFAFAGLWETWADPKDDQAPVYKSCAIITAKAGGSVRELHDRMPAVLIPELYEKWLNPEKQHPKLLRAMLRDGLVRDMRFYPVAKFVNSVTNNDPSCIEPIGSNGSFNR